MSRVTKWKIEKAKVKVVFRLQFHATLIPQSGWEKLFISFIPTETGKATAKTSKANVRNGSCKWADPIYETTRLLFDSKTKQYDDKLYKLVVGMGTSRSSILGEATINLADYADASQPSAIALPLHGTDHGTILHVTVQLLTAKTGFREFEQQRDKGLQRESESVTVKSSSSSDLQIPDDLVNKAKTRVQIHEEYSDSQVTCDESSNASEKVDFNEVDSIKSRLSSSQTSPTEKMNGPDRAKLAQTSDSDRLMDADMAIVYEENLRLRGSLEVAESSISELKTELTALQNHANEMGTKTEKITQELVTEIASSQELVKEVNVLKSECLKLKNDLQQLKETKSSSNFTENMVQFGEIPKLPLQELDTAKAEKENLVKKMDQMECYYESLVQELEENQKKILGEFQHLKNEHSTYKAETESLTSVNNELQKRATSAESALKRARLNYSIAVGQLQKDLDVLSFQVLSMFETNQTVIKEAFTDTSQPPPKHLSDDLKKSLSLQENIYKKVEEELGELCSANLQLDVYSGTLEETISESSAHIRKMNENYKKLAEKLQILDQSRVYYVSKCNDLHLQNQMLETDLGNLSNENFVFMEKITESEALLMDYKVYKSKHDQVSTQNQNLEKDMVLLNQELETLQREKDSAELALSTATSAIKNLEKDLVSVKSKFKNELHDIVAKMENPNLCLETIEMLIDSVGNKLKSSFESGEQKNEAFLSYLSSLEIELQKMSFEDKNFQEQIVSLGLMAQEFEKSNQDLRFLNDELSVEKNELEGTVASLTFELESQRLELENARKLASDQDLAQHEKNLENEARYIKENEILVKNLESIKLELEASIAQNLKISELNEEHALEVDQLKDMLTKSKMEVGQLQTKLQDSESRLKFYLENESRYVEENKILALEVDQLKDMLTKTEAHVGQLQTKLHDSESRLELYLENESRYVEENRNLALEVDQLKGMLTKTEANVGQLQTKLDDSELKLKLYLENEARYVKENSNLATELESVKLELVEASIHNAKSLESKNEHVLEVDQLKDMLTKSKTEVGQLQMKLNDSESRLKLYLENEARYTEENRNLLTEIESVRLKLDASIADNAECLESKNEYALEVDQQKDMLTKSKTEVDQLKDMLTKSKTEVDQLKDMLTKSKTEVDQLNDMLTKSKTEVDQLKELEMKLLDTKEKLDHRITNEARYIEENKSLKSELDAIIAHNAEISEALTKSKSEVDELKELEMKLLDTESRLNHCLEKEAHYIKENENLVTRFESVRLQLEASIAHNAEISEALTKSKSEAEPLKELEIKLLDTESRLNHCLEKEARYIEENKNLTTRYESVRLQLEASIAHNAEISEALTKSKSEIDQTKEKLDHQIETETHYIEENESLKLKLDAIIAQKANNDEDCTLISREKSEIILLLLKAKLDEQNDELTALQNKCNDLTNRLSEQILKTEEFKNLSKYLKDLKDNADVAREKKDPKGPVESLQMAFIKEQHQTKIQELKQQLSVSKKHNEEMLFKLQDALDEIESRKKSESLQLRRIEELETEIQSVNSVKPDYDRLQAELECAVLSLECCKEEKEKLVDLLQECEDEKSKITVEFSLVKEQLAQKEENGFTGLNGSVNPEIEQAIQEDEQNSLVNDSRQLMVVNDQFRSQHLKSCMEQLDQELEKMKNVNNSLLPLTNYDPSFQDLQSELAQLHQANEELGSIYPNFVDFAGNGNALERVLALEIELAEALRSKKKSSISSFLKQHSDEEAVFKSFRDINELIKEMLEIKGKYVNVENELKEMHDRYSQLSLQFAEVEGERQKLMMTLKNVRSSRNLLRLNRSSMAVIEDNPL